MSGREGRLAGAARRGYSVGSVLVGMTDEPGRRTSRGAGATLRRCGRADVRQGGDCKSEGSTGREWERGNQWRKYRTSQREETSLLFIWRLWENYSVL